MRHVGADLDFGVQDRTGVGPVVPIDYSGEVPDPFRVGREVIVTVSKTGGVLGRPARLAHHQVPVEIQHVDVLVTRRLAR